jgi:phospholipid/cholesterol/gamma-HCH transport system substrate-binding protein
MLRNNGFEIVLSAAIILSAIGFLVFMRWQTGTGSLSSYQMSAEMARADQVSVGTDVRIGGVTIGRVTSLSLEPRPYGVRIDMDIRSGIPIPRDSRLDVTGAMMSSPYLMITPGQSHEAVPPHGNLINK